MIPGTGIMYDGLLYGVGTGFASVAANSVSPRREIMTTKSNSRIHRDIMEVVGSQCTKTLMSWKIMLRDRESLSQGSFS